MITNAFVQYAADILGDTTQGLSGSKIAEYFTARATDFNVNIPFAEYPFPENTPNKRTALRENLKAFSPEQQAKIILELCKRDDLAGNERTLELKVKLLAQYADLLDESSSDVVDEHLVEETKHWLADYRDSLEPFQAAISKLKAGVFQRNLLDDLRLSLEKLVQTVLGNSKSLENQIQPIGDFLKAHHSSKELNNMFVKLIDYYCKYQNTYVKHNDAVVENEIEIVFEITCSFMKFLVRI